jgi:hypothetical protein
MTFGIVQSMLPFDEHGVMHWDFFHACIAQRKIVEEKRRKAAGKIISSTAKFDILLGRGRPFQEFSGNVGLAVVIDVHRNKYQSAKRGDKTVICDKIVEIIKKSGGRFLKREDAGDGNSWIEVNNMVAREKVSHGFRTKTKRNSSAVGFEERPEVPLDTESSSEVHKRLKAST